VGGDGKRFERRRKKRRESRKVLPAWRPVDFKEKERPKRETRRTLHTAQYTVKDGQIKDRNEKRMPSHNFVRWPKWSNYQKYFSAVVRPC